jgi:cytochrome c
MQEPVMKIAILVATSALFALSLAGAAQAQDAEAGAKVFLTCRQCHLAGENAKNLYGPNLNGVVGRKAGTAAGYAYSDAMKNSGIVWNEAALRDYLQKPKAQVPGTNMTFTGLTKPKDIEDVIAFLKRNPELPVAK